MSVIRNKCITKLILISAKRFLSSVSPAKPKVIIVGAGWGGFRLAKDINKNIYDVEIISPRNHFLFTPLLPSTAVGTLEFRCIQEPIRTIEGVKYSQAVCESIDTINQTVSTTHVYSKEEDVLKYDYLVLCPGSETFTFGCPGIYNNPYVHFLKQLSDARDIRNGLLECFERAGCHKISEEERKRLLTFVVVGGGPTNIEFASELYDFVKGDVVRWYPDLYKHINVVVIEASDHILGNFKASLASYVEKLFESRQIEVLKNTKVKEVRGNVAILGDDIQLPFGLMVWSTGIKQVPLIQNLSREIFSKSPTGRLLIDEHLKVIASDINGKIHNIFSLGDCAGDASKPLPPLAQVAGQQGKYLANAFNKKAFHSIPQCAAYPAFKYSHLGTMASVGDWKAVYDSTHLDNSPARNPPIAGFLAFLLWRAAYWTRSVSIVNKILIPMYWLKSAVFGRDISRF